MGARAAIFISAAGVAAGLVGYRLGDGSEREGRGFGSYKEATPIKSAPVQREEVDPVDPVAAATALCTAGEYVAAVNAILKIEGRSRRSQVLYEFYTSLDGSQLVALVSKLFAGGEADPVLAKLNNNPIDVFVLVDHWVELDPTGVEDLIVNGGEDSQDGLRTLALTFFAKRDLRRVMKLVGGRDGIDIASDEGLLYGMAISDPGAAIRFFIEKGMPSSWDTETIFALAGVRVGEALDGVLSVRDEDVRDGLIIELFTEWGQAAPERALERALTLGEAELRATVLRAVMDVFAEIDAPAAAGVLGRLKSSVDDRRMARIVASRWGRSDPEAALRWGARHLESPAFRMLLEKYGNKASPAVVMELISEMDRSGRKIFLSRSAFENEDHFLQRVVRRDPRAAIGWLVANGGEQLAVRGAARLGKIVATRDMSAAQVVVEELPLGRFRDRFVLEVAEEFGGRNPVAALRWADTLAGDETSVAMQAILRGWTWEDPESAAFFARKSGRSDLLKGVLAQWCRSDAEGTYRWLVRDLAGGADAVLAEIASIGLMETWGGQDPAAAARGSLGFPEDIAAGLLSGVIGRWAAAEPLRASAFINDVLSVGPVRDAAVVALAQKIADDDLAAAVAWAHTIEDVGVRYSTLESLATE